MTTAKYTLPGTTRAKSPQDTLQRILPLLSEFGISSLSYDSSLQTLPLPVYQCVRPYGKSITVTQGKGLTDDLSKISALMESIEFSQAENLPPATCIATYEELKKNQVIAIDPRQLATYSDDRLLHLPITWMQGLDLHQKTPVLLPRAYFDMDFTRSYPENLFIKAISNGLASGNTWSEAVVHGLLELIERHGIGKTKKMTIADRVAQLVDVDTIVSNSNMPQLKNIFNAAKELNYKILIENLTHDFGLPCFHCEIHYENLFTSHSAVYPFSGAGCHFDKEIALSRAVTEAVQSAVTIIASAKDNLHINNLPQPGPLGYPAEAKATLDYAAIQNAPSTLSFEDDLQFLLQHLKEHGFQEAYVVDISSQQFNIPVAFVAVPGMKYAWV